MGRSRTFDETAVLRAAAAVFVARGYEGASVDDLLGALGLHRGSLYQAFGSKRGLFLAALTHHVRAVLPAGTADGSTLDLVLVAAVERGPHDAEVAALVDEGVALLGAHAPHVLGARLLARLHPSPAGSEAS